MFRFKRPREFRLTWRQCAYVMLYTLAMVVVMVVLHESAHILAAMALGARFSELKLGFMGINPSVTLPEWFTGARQTVVHYAGGLAVGTVFLLFISSAGCENTGEIPASSSGHWEQLP